MKASADYKVNVAKMMLFLNDRIEIIVGKGEQEHRMRVPMLGCGVLDRG